MHVKQGSGLMGVVILGLAASVHGQTETGHALDANLELGSGGINRFVVGFDAGASNRVVTGNVIGGRAFRGLSPIGNASSLMMGIPSSDLSSFRRDSFGLSNLPYGTLPRIPSAYFAPERTATTLQAIRLGINLPGSTYDQAALTVPRFDLAPAANLTGTYPYQVSQPLIAPLSLRPLTVPLTSERLLVTPETILNRARSDRFDAGRSGLLSNTDWATPLNLRSADSGRLRLTYDELQLRSTGAVSPTLAIGDELLESTTLTRPGFLTPVDLANPLARRTVLSARLTSPSEGDVASAGSAARLTPLGNGSLSDTPTAIPGWGAENASPSEADRAPVADDVAPVAGAFLAGEITSSSGFAPRGFNAIDDFNNAVEFLFAHQEYLASRSSAGREDVGGSEAYRDSVDAARALIASPLPSFAGDRDTLLNRYVRRAESSLKKGEFYKAVSMYKVATAFSRDDPLIELGMGHAFLGVGDYRSAFLHLTAGIDRFDVIACFRIDLSTFLTDPALLDIRRADLEKRLARTDDYELRFLLGYAEYYSGLQQFGMANLRLAAELAPEGTVVARLPALLDADCVPLVETAD